MAIYNSYISLPEGNQLIYGDPIFKPSFSAHGLNFLVRWVLGPLQRLASEKSDFLPKDKMH